MRNTVTLVTFLCLTICYSVEACDATVKSENLKGGDVIFFDAIENDKGEIENSGGVGPGVTRDECCSYCAQTPGCAVWNWCKADDCRKQGLCTLKTLGAKGETFDDPTNMWISGVMETPLPESPPSPPPAVASTCVVVQPDCKTAGGLKCTCNQDADCCQDKGPAACAQSNGGSGDGYGFADKICFPCVDEGEECNSGDGIACCGGLNCPSLPFDGASYTPKRGKCGGADAPPSPRPGPN